jgi:hypothetical protein
MGQSVAGTSGLRTFVVSFQKMMKNPAVVFGLVMGRRMARNRFPIISNSRRRGKSTSL